MTETGRTLRALRHGAGLSLAALAAIVGCSDSFLCDVELGKRRMPRARVWRLPETMREPIWAALREDVFIEAEIKLARLG